MNGTDIRTMARYGGNAGVISCLWLIALSTVSRGQVSNPCTEERPYKYVLESRTLVDTHGRATVLDTLDCIARTADGATVRAAIEAFFHLADDDAMIENRLLAMMVDPSSQRATRSYASQFVVYVISDQGRTQLLDQVMSAQLGDDVAGPFDVLVTVGDLRILDWIEQRIVEHADNVDYKRYMERAARKIRVQHDPELLLTTLASDDQMIAKIELLHQGLRHGVDHQRLRDAVQTFLRANPNGKHHGRLIQECRECGVFDEHNVAEFNIIQPRRSVGRITRPGPSWATRFKEKKRKFWDGMPASP